MSLLLIRLANIMEKWRVWGQHNIIECDRSGSASWTNFIGKNKNMLNKRTNSDLVLLSHARRASHVCPSLFYSFRTKENPSSSFWTQLDKFLDRIIINKHFHKWSWPLSLLNAASSDPRPRPTSAQIGVFALQRRTTRCLWGRGSEYNLDEEEVADALRNRNIFLK